MFITVNLSKCHIFLCFKANKNLIENYSDLRIL